MRFQRILSNKYGRFGEELVSEVLSKRNHTKVASRYKTPYGEIDIITICNDSLIFSEVKARSVYKEEFSGQEFIVMSNVSFDAFEKIFSRKQMQRMIDAASFFNAQNQQFSSYNQRFDLYLVKGKRIIEHFENISMQ
ncbi:YraN family protein [Candidatus Fokinia crypta]|uniref:UPF0102 protein Fokcrypt_00172 n=1 Tax=Candidatus Fokinia crypta TaxID=1920990 RepID=A0ABZ0USJ3_9RICK|nr:YraN family protein [Candidatus Fokinia cryptica]WPX97663.1 Putative YraN family nuclease [Candidatus Fokinia cryptica]